VPRVLLLLVLVLPAACSDPAPPAPVARAEVVLEGASSQARLFVQIADTPAERAQGLMGRTSLAPDAGMAFLWAEPVTSTFWMKDTKIPLAIAFWARDGTIVSIREMTPCTADPCATYAADAPFVGAVEANTGYFAEHGIAAGDRATVLRDHG
jgi:uncharacterized membrane protein (UPF0127 family)